jgi:ribosomal protein S1
MLLRSGEHEIFVNHDEICWPPWPSVELPKVFPVGSETSVYVMGYMYPRQQVLGSIKRVQPEDNPYRQLARLAPGTVFLGRVEHIDPTNGWLSLTLPAQRVSGTVPVRNLLRRGKQGQFRVGDNIDVVIEQLEIHQELLEFDLPANTTRKE